MDDPKVKNLETDRLLLRQWQPEDVTDLHEYAGDPEVAHMAGWKPHTDLQMSREVLQSYIESNAAWAIVLKETGKVIGHIKLTPDENRGAYVARYLSYALSAAYWNQGYMTEAARTVIQYVFLEQPWIDMLSAFHVPENDRSRRVIEKCGFLYDCTIPQVSGEQLSRTEDHVCYHLLRSEYFATYRL